MLRTTCFLFALLLSACSRDRGDDDDDVTGDGDADTDADTDADADADTDADGDGDIDRPVDAEAIETWARELSADEMEGRDEGTPGGAAARAYIIDALEECGLTPAVDGAFEQPITSGDGTNVLARVDGTDPERRARTVIVSAHYDHLGDCDGDICNGADDNAAAVGMVLSVACAFQQAPAARSILFAFWDAEEPPTFLRPEMGSRFYVEHPVVPLADTDVAIALDLVGAGLWDGYAGHFAIGGETAPQLAEAIAATEVPDGLLVYPGGLHLVEETPLGHQPWSDYDEFRNEEVPVLFLSNGQTKRYHTEIDEADTLDFPKIVLQARWLAELVGRLGAATATPAWSNDLGDHGGEATMMVEVLEAALAPDGIVDSLGLSGASRGHIEDDLDAVRDIAADLGGGGSASESDIDALRRATQRLMCYAGSSYEESMCGYF